MPRGARTLTGLGFAPAAEIEACASTRTCNVTVRPERMRTARLPTTVVPRVSSTVPLQTGRTLQVTVTMMIGGGVVRVGPVGVPPTSGGETGRCRRRAGAAASARTA